MNNIYRYIGVIFLLPGFILGSTAEQEDKKHRVTVNHPAFGKEDSNTFYLSEQRGDSNTVEGYFLDVASVICFDKHCKIVPVRIYWNILGSYQKYELPKGVLLEKKKGEAFLPEDYDRLHEILKDKSSPYSDFSYYEITHERVQGEGEIDAVSGPSPIIIDETKTIAGAAWTCFTLWHWANGEIVQEIQRVTGAASSTQDLRNHLASGNQLQQLFAINESTKRKDHSPQVIQAVVEQASKEELPPQFLRKTLAYLEESQTASYYASLKTLLQAGAIKRRIILWNSILKYSHTPPEGYFDILCKRVLASKDYQEINLFLTILEQKKSSTDYINEKILPLLKEDYSIINRRIYYFLEKQPLSDAQKQIMQSYYKLYSDNL